ncbi:DUF2268 domain-containing protein [Bacillus sp. SCS-153A]|uniref:DUF2268 domain-containing protein n=1 Tax=Rossellomorea sedimentorum TaxID=3115294 RepID=UPI003905808D
MAIVETSHWLDECVEDPEKLLMKKGITKKKAAELYEYLKSFGMYTPAGNMKYQLNSLKKRQAWRKMSVYYKKYRSLWNGPSVPVYIFPVQTSRGLFTSGLKKSGVSFRDEIYLFLSDEDDPKEWEALFLHEYHHCTRMNLLKKSPDQYTLLDSIIFEGLAEDAVKEYCGEPYVSSWAKKYSEFLLQKLWNQHIKNELHLRRKDSKHDQLLLGKGRYPNLIGYAIGYYIVGKFREKHGMNAEEMMGLDAAGFIEDKKILES